MDEVRKARQDITTLQKENRGIGASVNKLLEETKKLAQEVHSMQDKAFTIKGSEYQVCTLY